MKRYLINELKRLLDDLENDRVECDPERISLGLSMISHRPVSSYEAYTNILHISRSSFYEYIDQKKLPAGRKRQGFKELIWYEDELIAAKKKLKQ